MYLHTKIDNKNYENIKRLDLLFEKKCEKYLNNDAVIIGEKHYSYKELNERANQLARYLIKKGVKPGSRVGILLDKSLNTYVTLLAILKANAAYVPLDITFPIERIKYIVNDANISMMVSHSSFEFIFKELEVEHIFLDKEQDLIQSQEKSNLSKKERLNAKENLCYIIYTSGTTGNPKGVAIEHRSIAHFVQVASKAYGIKETDRVYQGMIIAFDFSVEEIWVPLISGAALVPAKSAKCMLGEELNDYLIKNRVSVLCCVPTLLATLEKDIPTLRLLLVGGEACPHDLVVKWHRQDRIILNTYGPTEATVTATYTRLLPEKPVTIGKPLEGYSIVILDEKNKALKKGEIGEIAIGGIGLARGYINREDLTKKVFIPDFLNLPDNPTKRIYKTGDLGKIDENGEVVYLGRIDTQVKIRGYRIELSEIESVFAKLDGVAQVAVNPYTFDNGTTELVAYCVLKDNYTSLPKNWSEIVSKKLPGYMIPSYIEIIDSLPMSPSNKVDRKRLPKPKSSRVINTSKEFVEASSKSEKMLAKIISEALGLEQVSVEDNFFDDLGGHSLSIAVAVSKLRSKGIEIGLSDFYAHPTVRELAKYIDSLKKQKSKESKDVKKEHYKVSNSRYWFMGIVQLLLMFLYAAVWAFPSVVLIQDIALHWSQYSTKEIILSFIELALVLFVVALILPIAAKWLLLGRVKEGKHKLWSWYWLRFWLVNKAFAFSPHGILRGTKLLNIYYNFLGAKIGKDVMLNSAAVFAPDMIEIGEHTTVGLASALYGYEIREGYIHFGKVKIGSNCYIGANSLIMPNSVMEDGSYLGDQSLLQDAKIAKNKKYTGSPAKEVKNLHPMLQEIEAISYKEKVTSVSPNFWTTVGIVVLPAFIFVLIGVILYFLIASTINLYISTFYNSNFSSLNIVDIVGVSLVAALSFLIFYPLVIIVFHNLFMPSIKEGIYKINSFTYIRKLISDALIASTLALINGMYATLYLPPFLRKLGAKVGKFTEISTVANITPSLLEISDESFLADIATVGPYYLHKGYFALKRVKIGRRSFVGNAAFVPAGSEIPDEVLIGVLSVPPYSKMKKGSTWLGSPSFELPRRQESQYFDESLTYRPTKELYIKRWIYEFFRFFLPSLFFYFFAFTIWEVFYKMLFNYSAFTIALTLPLLTLASGIISAILVALIKKLLIGNYTPKVKPLWDIFVRRSELVTALFENITVPGLLVFFTGTPFAALILRMYGVKVGKRCFIETTYVTEFDLVEIGDDCSIAPMTSLQTHLFEDRVMKMSYVKVKNGCSIGVRSVVLYDALLEEDVVLDSLSLVMKGERLSYRGRYRGIPVEKITQ